MDTWIVTGGAGFIGSNFVRLALAADRRTESSSSTCSPTRATSRASPTSRTTRASSSSRPTSPTRDAVEADLREQHRRMPWSTSRPRPTSIAPSTAPAAFVRTNLTWEPSTLLDAARRRSTWAETRGRRLDRRGLRLAGRDRRLLARPLPTRRTRPTPPPRPAPTTSCAPTATYGLPTLITNCSNNYGPYQFPEKLIPLMILNALEGKPLPIYGDGGNVRDWLYVEDHCAGILACSSAGASARSTTSAAATSARTSRSSTPSAPSSRTHPARRQNPRCAPRGVATTAELKTFVKDRPGHDRRYAIDAEQDPRRARLATPPTTSTAAWIDTVQWYLENRAWCEAVQSDQLPARAPRTPAALSRVAAD